MTLKTRPGVTEIAPYVGGEASIPGIAHPIKLSSNENPLGASPKAIAAFREAASEMHRYFDGFWAEVARLEKAGDLLPRLKELDAILHRAEAVPVPSNIAARIKAARSIA